MKKYLYEVDVKGHDAPAKVLRAVGSGKRVLEVGCASGVQTKILRDAHGCTVTGIEIDPAAARDAAEYCNRVIVGDLETLDLNRELAGQRFDVIVIADVLEHLKHPARVLKQLRSLLDEGGYIVASIPNVVYAGLVLEMACGKFDYRPYGLLDDTHLRFFTLKSICRLFEDCDLVIRKVDRVLRPVEHTEFGSRPSIGQIDEMLRLIQSNNEEWQTYQFVVEAVANPLPATTTRFADLELKEQSTTNRALLQKARTLQSRLAWIESRPWYRLLVATARVLRPARG
jgi:SAM-dependent methyltransferase